MAAAKQQNTIVGIFALVGLVVLTGLAMMFGGGRTIFHSVYDVNVAFPNGIVGVQEDQGVMLSGKRIGTTKAVRFIDEKHLEKGVIIVVSVDKVYFIPTASEMMVAAPIMGFGRPQIQIVVTDSSVTTTLPKDGTGRLMGRMVPILDQVLPPQMQQTLEKATADIGHLAEAMRPLAANLGRMTEQRSVSAVDLKEATANIDSLVQRFDATVKSINEIIGDPANRQNFADSLANVKKMSESGVVVMDNLKQVSGDGKQLVADGSQLIRKLAVTADDLSAVLKRMDQTLVAMNSKDGTIGLMLNDNRLYEEMVLSARRLTKALDDMREVLDMAKKGQLRIKAF